MKLVRFTGRVTPSGGAGRRVRLLASVTVAVMLHVLAIGVPAQELGETLEWIVVFLKENGGAKGSYGSATWDYMVTTRVVAPCALALTVAGRYQNETEFLQRREMWSNEFTLRLVDLVPPVSVADGSDGSWLTLTAGTGRTVSRQEEKTEEGATYDVPKKVWVPFKRERRQELLDRSIQFPARSRESADRLGRAFTHAITLCGGKKDLF